VNTDNIESLRAELDLLRAEFAEFKAYAQPVIDGHQPLPPEIKQRIDMITRPWPIMKLS
jgi:hypothetical protein